MAVFAGNDMKIWRELKGMTAADLAERISCDVTTVYRYESGKLKPNPDIMYRICYELGDVNRWVDWMRTEYPASYGCVHPEAKTYDLAGNIMSMFVDASDLLAMQMKVMKDAADGKLDDTKTKTELKNELESMVGIGTSLLNMLKRKE